MRGFNKVFIALLLMFLFTGCSQKEVKEAKVVVEPEVVNEGESETIELKVAAPSGVPLLSMIQMIYEEQNVMDNTIMKYEIIEATDVLVSRLMSRELDIAIVPTNLAAQLHNKGLDYKLVSSNVWGIFYLVGTDEINSWDDLKGKDIYTMGQGLTPDITFRYLLTQHGLDPEVDVNLIYLSGATELAPTFISGKSTLSVMPEPMVSTVLAKKEGAEILFDLQEEWKIATSLESSYPQASLIVKKEALEDYEDVINAFVEQYQESIHWLYDNPEIAGQYAEALQTGIPAAMVPLALPRMNIEHVLAGDAKQSVEAYLQVLFESDPNTIGGHIPDASFYYELKTK
jgi:NitT/TauT family transport system substrate-binding protein